MKANNPNIYQDNENLHLKLLDMKTVSFQHNSSTEN